MIHPGEALLLAAHPGHEILLHGWLGRAKPVVCILTDGSGHASAPRLEATAEVLRDTGARRGALFGRLSDREAYAMLLEGNTALLLSIVADLAAAMDVQRPGIVVADAVEGYSPVHDLCRLIAGAAIEMADVDAKLYEYAVVDAPFDPMSGGAIALDLDDDAYIAKMERACTFAPRIGEIDALLRRHGAEAYRREVLQPVLDWTSLGGGNPPLYENLGETRVAAGRYASVIRRNEHMIPLRDALLSEMKKRTCAF